MDKKKNRPKKQRISVCVDEELSNKILEAQKLGYTKSAYIQSLIRDKPIININLYRQLIPYICEIEKQMEFEDDVNVKRAVREELNKICHVLKIVNEPYLNKDAPDILIHQYVFRKAVCVGGYNVNPKYAAYEMHMVKDLWFQNEGKQLRHFIVSFSDYESKQINSAGSLSILAYQICSYYSDFQIVFGVHRSNNWHIHFVMNTVNFRTGEKYKSKKFLDYDLKYHIQVFLSGDSIPVYYN